MTSSTSVHAAILAALQGAGVYAVPGPADDLPTAADGRVAQAAVLWPAAPLHLTTRLVGESSSRIDQVHIVCVGATAFDALAVADKVHGALNGLRTSPKGGTLSQTARAKSPQVEPNADPYRFIFGLEYTTTTKG